MKTRQSTFLAAAVLAASPVLAATAFGSEPSGT